MSQEELEKLLKKVDDILAKPEEEISTKESLEAIKLKLELIRSINKLKYFDKLKIQPTEDNPKK